MIDGTGLAEVLLGLSGFRVLDVVEDDSEVVIGVETTATRAFCRSCGVRAEPQDRMRVDVCRRKSPKSPELKFSSWRELEQ